MGKLVIVESPSKAKTIKKYLGGDYEVIASQGHIVDLPANKLAVDVDNDFKPEYKTMPDKAKLIKDIKEQAKDKLIIAENLGSIDQWVIELLNYSGFKSMSVFQFGFDGNPDNPHLPHNFNNNTVAFTGTHDNNTLLGYMWESDEQTKKKILDYFGYNGDWNSCYDTILRTMFQSSSGLVILPLQDLLLYGSDTRLNKPGNACDNWAFRITSEQINLIDKEKFLKWNKLYARI